MGRLQVATAIAIASLRVSLGSDPIDVRVASLLANMTVDEKVAQLFYGGQPSSNISELLALMPYGIGALSVQSLTERNAIQAAFMGSTRLGIPVSFYGETLRSGSTANVTIFPMPALLGCSWNTSLAEAMGRVVATEAWSNGIDRSFSPVIQVTTDPRWGRVPENFGESELLVALMGAAETRGLLGPGGGGGPSTYLPSNFSLIATAKHAIAYGASNADGYAVDASSRLLHDVYLKSWREFAAAGGRGLMVSHPALNDVPMHANAAVLNATLRGMPGLEGAVFGSDNENVRWLSDSFDFAANESDAAVRAINAGVDQEMDGFTQSLYLKWLPAAVASGAVPMSSLDRAAGNVLRYKFAAGLFDAPPERDPSLPATHCRTPAALALQRDVVMQGAVLLTNGGGVLPLPLLHQARAIAVLGPNGGGCPADPAQGCEARGNMVGSYSPYNAFGNNGAVVVPTVEDAVRASFPAADVTFLAGAALNSTVPDWAALDAATAAAAAADAVFLVLGDSACLAGFGLCSCGEGADRVSLDLPGTQQALLKSVLNATGNLAGATVPADYGNWQPYSRPGGPIPVVVILIHGRPVTFDAAHDNWLLPGAAPGSHAALIAAWLPSEQGADALLQLVTGGGGANFAGRTAQTWPRSVGHIRTPGHPFLQLPGSQGPGPNDWLPPREGPTGAGSWAPLFSLGAGLSYTTFAVSGMQVTPAAAPVDPSGTVNVTVLVSNTGARDGIDTVFVAYSVTVPGVMRYHRQLAGFARVFVPAGGAAPVTIVVRQSDLDRFDPVSGASVIDSAAYTLYVGDCLDAGWSGHQQTPCAAPMLTATLTLSG